mmetsp:Transcript_12291/g.34535  ORF Transcript_12291/g.34535 Transcript_12291/m.34535 type:complete len:243 (+) Transcript_12291:217-945(+)
MHRHIAIYIAYRDRANAPGMVLTWSRAAGRLRVSGHLRGRPQHCRQYRRAQSAHQRDFDRRAAAKGRGVGCTYPWIHGMFKRSQERPCIAVLCHLHPELSRRCPSHLSRARGAAEGGPGDCKADQPDSQRQPGQAAVIIRRGRPHVYRPDCGDPVRRRRSHVPLRAPTVPQEQQLQADLGPNFGGVPGHPGAAACAGRREEFPHYDAHGRESHQQSRVQNCPRDPEEIPLCRHADRYGQQRA